MLRVALKKLARKLVRKKVKNLLLTTVKHALSVSLYEGLIFLSYFKEKRIKKCQKKDVILIFTENGSATVKKLLLGFVSSHFLSKDIGSQFSTSI